MADPREPLLPTRGSLRWSSSAQTREMSTAFNSSLSSAKTVPEVFFSLSYLFWGFSFFVLLKRIAIKLNIYTMAF